MTQPVSGVHPRKIKAYLHTKSYTLFIFTKVWLLHIVTLISGVDTNLYITSFVEKEDQEEEEARKVIGTIYHIKLLSFSSKPVKIRESYIVVPGTEEYR